MKKDIMIDIETMGDTHDAAMIQIAAVHFDRETGETGREFIRNIDLEDCIDEGFKTSKSTREWWAEQDQKVLQGIKSCPYPAKQALEEFTKMFGEATIVWSHATFDFVIVQNYLKHFGLKEMPFRGARDIRTLVDLSGIDLDSYDWDKKTHNALDDCKFQIEYCVDAMNAIIKELK